MRQNTDESNDISGSRLPMTTKCSITANSLSRLSLFCQKAYIEKRVQRSSENHVELRIYIVLFTGAHYTSRFIYRCAVSITALFVSKRKKISHFVIKKEEDDDL